MKNKKGVIYMRLFKSIDERFEELGFKKKKENEFGIIYSKDDNEYKHKIDIFFKSDGECLAFIYDETIITNERSLAVGLNERELKLIFKKVKQLKRKYKK